MSISAAELPEMSRDTGAGAAAFERLRARLERRAAARRVLRAFRRRSAFSCSATRSPACCCRTAASRTTDSVRTWAILAGSAVGLVASALGRLYSSTFYALRDTRTPLWFAVVRVILTGVLGYLFAFPLPRMLGLPAWTGAAGLTASAGIAGWVEFLLLRRAITHAHRRDGHVALAGSRGSGAPASSPASSGWGVMQLLWSHGTRLRRAASRRSSRSPSCTASATLALGVPEARALVAPRQAPLSERGGRWRGIIRIMAVPASILDKIPHLPESPGVYLWRDAEGKVLYVGKAKRLRSRVRSYVASDHRESVKTRALMQQAEALDTIVVPSEAHALILEANLIKEYKPRFNIALRDDKSYPYIKVTVQEPFPRVWVTRRLQNDGARYFGPYTDVGAMRRSLDVVKRLFTVRSCNFDMPKQMPDRPCLDYHIGRCKAPCILAQTQGEYAAMIDEVLDFLDGKPEEVERKVRERMALAAESLDFERAAQLRDVAHASREDGGADRRDGGRGRRSRRRSATRATATTPWSR